MTMYATKVWGFASAQWPLITFSKEGVRNRLARQWQPGDTMLLIGTQQAPTAEEDQGKILGYLEFTSFPVLTRNIVAPEILSRHGDKWPYALLCTESWALEEPPIFKAFLPEVAAKNPGMTLASSYTALSAEEEVSIRQLAARHEILPRNEHAQRAVDQTNLAAALRNGGRGPVTFTGTYEVTRHSAPAETYLLQYKTTDSRMPKMMKVGWAYDASARADHLSEPLVTKFTGAHWKLLQKRSWPHEYAARFMEQTMLDLLGEQGIEFSKEYFKQPLKENIVTSELWYEALLKTNTHLETLSDSELLGKVSDVLADL